MKLTLPTKIISLAIVLSSLACKESDYQRLVKRELATGVINDSLLFNFKFGQSKQYFLQSCWQLNQKGIISSGPENTTVQYQLPTKQKEPSPTDMTLLFFGDFNEEKIMTGMNLQFYYNSWSPWNTSVQSEKLLPVVMDTLKSWYAGNDFIKVPLKGDSLNLFVKIDGNRRITIRPLEDSRLVKADIDDLRYSLDKN